MTTESQVEDFYSAIRYPGPDALITYLWANRLKPYVPKEPFVFLDAGCGSGRHAAGILDLFPQARGHCLDLSQPSLDEADALFTAKEFRDRASFIQGSYLDPIDLPEPVDIAIAIGTIHHCTDPGQALKNIADCVKPGGHVACMIYGSRGHQRRYELKEALGLVSDSFEELEALHKNYKRKYQSLLDRTPRSVIRTSRDQISHFTNRILGRKRFGYQIYQDTGLFLRDGMMSPIDVAFDTNGVKNLLDISGLELVANLGLGRLDTSLLPEGWKPHWDKLDVWQRTRLSELLDPQPRSWSFIAQKT